MAPPRVLQQLEPSALLLARAWYVSWSRAGRIGRSREGFPSAVRLGS